MAKAYERKWITSKGQKKKAWRIDYVDSLGKRHQVGSFKTKREAELELYKIKFDMSKGINVSVNKNITFKEAAEKHIKFYAEVYCKKSTCDGYRGYIKYHLAPFFGNAKMVDISTMNIKEFIKLKQNEKLAAQTINHCVTLLGSIFERLIDDGILYQNPVKRVKKLKITRPQVEFFNHEEIKRLLNTAKEYYPDFYPLLYTAIFTGMRRGELIALTWKDINFETKKLTVNKSFHKNALSKPKTTESIRTIDLSPSLIRVLKEWKENSIKHKSQIVFPNSIGKHNCADNIIKRKYNPTLKLAGLDRIKFHVTRHTYASILISANVTPKYIQQQMGHSSIKVTLDTYGHLMPDTHKQGVKALDNVMDD